MERREADTGIGPLPRVAYKKKRFSSATLAVIDQANAILAEYASHGIIVTLRQPFYQFVARDVIANKQKGYKCLD